MSSAGLLEIYAVSKVLINDLTIFQLGCCSYTLSKSLINTNHITNTVKLKLTLAPPECFEHIPLVCG